MRCLLLLVVSVCWATDCVAQQFDGICRLTTTTGEQFSGVAVAETTILTIAHYRDVVPGTVVFAEFPENGHGGLTRLKLRTVVQKIDKASDLCLLRFQTPPWAKLRRYKISMATQSPEVVLVRGYVGETPMQLSPRLLRRGDALDGRLLDAFHGIAVTGMSGAPAVQPDNDELIGMQLGGDAEMLHIITLPTIQKFVE